MKHQIKFNIPFIATIDDESELGKTFMNMVNRDFKFFEMGVGGSTLLTEEFDEYLEKMNEGSKALVVSLDKTAII